MTDYADLIRQLREKAHHLFKRRQRDCESLGVTSNCELEKSIEWQAAAAIAALVKERDTLVQECELLEQEKNMLEDDVEPLNQEICNLKDIIGTQQKSTRLGIGQSLDGFLQELGELDEVTRLAFQRHGEQCLRNGERIGLEKAAKVAEEVKLEAYCTDSHFAQRNEHRRAIVTAICALLEKHS